MSTEEESNKRQKTSEMKRVLIFGGKTGWIGQMMADIVKKEGTNRFRAQLSVVKIDPPMAVGSAFERALLLHSFIEDIVIVWNAVDMSQIPLRLSQHFFACLLLCRGR
jgi:hypothetical protein